MKKITILFFAALWLWYDASAQCFPNRHSTNFFDGWVSCEAAESPNPVRGSSHFIMYDYGKLYALGQMEIWNSNDPSHLDWGMRDVAIDVSADGETWEEAGVYTFNQASGLSTYEGEEGPHLGDIEGRYLLITALNNYGGECYGLSEVRVHAEEVIISDVETVRDLPCVAISVYPNPFAEKVSLTLEAGCSGDVQIQVIDALGKIVYHDAANLIPGQSRDMIFGADLPAGAYTVNLKMGSASAQRTIVKMSRT